MHVCCINTYLLQILTRDLYNSNLWDSAISIYEIAESILSNSVYICLKEPHSNLQVPSWFIPYGADTKKDFIIIMILHNIIMTYIFKVYSIIKHVRSL